MICARCEHPESQHPNHVFCHVDDCRCAGWVKLVEGVNDD